MRTINNDDEKGEQEMTMLSCWCNYDVIGNHIHFLCSEEAVSGADVLCGLKPT